MCVSLCVGIYHFHYALCFFSEYRIPTVCLSIPHFRVSVTFEILICREENRIETLESILSTDKCESKSETNPLIKLSTDGHLNTTATRIDFTREDWYEQFQQIVSYLDSVQSLDENDLTAWWSQQNGYSGIRPFRDYAILTNACTSFPFASVHLFEEKRGSVTSKAKQFNKGNDFYCMFQANCSCYSFSYKYQSTNFSLDNRAVSESSPLPPERVSMNSHMLLLHPRQYTNIFHILEGTSFVMHLAIHPELYPSVRKMMMVNLE